MQVLYTRVYSAIVELLRLLKFQNNNRLATGQECDGSIDKEGTKAQGSRNKESCYKDHSGGFVLQFLQPTSGYVHLLHIAFVIDLWKSRQGHFYASDFRYNPST